MGELIMSMKEWNEYIEDLREVRAPRKEPTPFKSAYQKKTKGMRKRNDITAQSSQTTGHKNLDSGAPFNDRTQPAGTDRLRFEEDIDPSSIELGSFDIKADLERRIWKDGDHLRPLFREYMMKIALDFIEGLDIPVKVQDIKLTGSIANYNWSKFSDIDLHIVVDLSDYGEDEDIIRGFFDGKRIAWNHTHNIKLAGYDVELYIEGSEDLHISTGMYSVLKEEWITKPERQDQSFDEDLVRQKAVGLMDLIDASEEALSREDYKAAHLLSDKLKDKIRRMRKCGLEKSGAYSAENLAFKVMRRNGYLEKLSDVKNRAYDGLHTVATAPHGIKVKI